MEKNSRQYKGGCVCNHLLEGEASALYRQYTGVGLSYNLLCAQCFNTLKQGEYVLQEVSQEQFQDIDDFCDGVVGEPEILERKSTLSFSHQIVKLEALLQSDILSIKPKHGVQTSIWIALLTSGEIVQLDLSQSSIQNIATIPHDAFDLSQKTTLHLASNNRFIAIVHDVGSDGIIFDLSTQQITMTLNRGTYHAKETPFPIAFFDSGNDVLVVHGTDWNRLDISDPQTGKLLTERHPIPYRRGETRPEHYLDYFHSQLFISPNAKWIAEDGWVWHPVGISRVWQLDHWLTKNIWESEDGASIKTFTRREYHWNAPLYWANDTTLVIWGIGDDDCCMIPAAQVFDVHTGEQIRCFAGP